MILIHNYFPGKMHKYAMKYVDILEANQIECKIIDIHQEDFFDLIKETELFLNYTGTDTIHLQQLKSINSVINKNLKINTFPNYETAWHLDDKISQHYLLKNSGFPVVDCYIFWDKQIALNFAEQTAYPIIFKLKGGAGSLNVCKVDTVKHAKKLINAMFGKGIKNGSVPGIKKSTIYNSNFRRVIKAKAVGILSELGIRNKSYQVRGFEYGYALFQKFLPNNNNDIRVTVIGERAFAFRRFNRKNDFRSSGSGIINYDHTKINIEAIKIAFQVSEKMNFQTMAYDFLVDTDGSLKIIEICHMFADWAVFNSEGYWDKDLKWHEGHYWPQFSELQNLLGREDLIQPEFEVKLEYNNLTNI